MLEERTYKIFQHSIEAKMKTGEVLLPHIVSASQVLVQSLLSEGKILICGNGPSAALAQILTNQLINRFERERPSLPAIVLGCDLTNATAIAYESSFNEIFAKEIRALGSAGDTLVIISSSGNPSNLIQAIQAAHERSMNVITLTGRDGGNLSLLLDVDDVELLVPLDSRARIHELHLLSIFCLCDLIDEQLFGPIDG
ncbi:phosphoheptose isomerase [Candidatus Endobugula sertula]|uniref:Phosphoheptose isomerase n=1 Tax=Candidatus Endobugula sertula TaxID=62101 RepID=A0A1D2QTM9_9GAMM|nr:phosphoheptose isomerase [Candidatus Endobugula sertula]